MFKRRHFLKRLTAAGAATSVGLPAAQAENDGTPDIDPYYLDSGDLGHDGQRQVEDLVGWQERAMKGQTGVKPRGPGALAPTYRLLRWTGPIGSEGRFDGALSVEPQMPQASAYQLNAQILGLHVSRDDWRGRRNRGTLTVEFRTRLHDEPMTWLFAQQFDVGDGGRTTMGLEFVGQRDGVRDAVVTDDASLDLRIQLIRHRRGKGLLRQVLQIAAYVIGLPTGGLTGAAATFAQTLPIVRVPRLLREAAAFSQALFGGLSDEAPIWRSGLTSYALAKGRSRLALTPGLWVAIDESREVDLRGVVLSDIGGTLALTRNGQRLNANHLVLDLMLAPAELTASGRVVESDDVDDVARPPVGVQPRPVEE